MIAKTNLHDIIDYMNLIEKLKKVQSSIKKIADQVVEKVSLHLVFLFGIGLTNIVARLLFNNFTTRHYYFSSWSKKHLSNTHTKMY